MDKALAAKMNQEKQQAAKTLKVTQKEITVSSHLHLTPQPPTSTQRSTDNTQFTDCLCQA